LTGGGRPRGYIGGLPVTVVAIVCVTSAIELALAAADFGLIGSPSWRVTAYAYGAFWAQLLGGAAPVYPGQPVAMFATYALLHGGLLHLAVNMLALASLGRVIVERVGQKRFLIAYAISTLGGAAGYGLLAQQAVPMVGASGALFGLVGVWVCWDYLDRRHYGDPLGVTLRAFAFLIAYNVVFWILLSGRLAWETHLGGFIAGWLLAVHWGRSTLEQSRRRRFGKTVGPRHVRKG